MSEFGFGGGPPVGPGESDKEFGGFGAGAQQPAGNGQPVGPPPGDDEFTLDFTEAEDVPVYQLLPAGEYTLMVTEAVPTRARTGAAMVAMKLKVWDEGPFEGRFLPTENLVVPNPRLVQEGKQPADKFKKQLDFFCNTLECITGVQWKGQTRTLKPKEHLENQICRAYVTQKPNSNDPNLKHNEIARFLPKTSAPTSSGAPTGFGGFGS